MKKRKNKPETLLPEKAVYWLLGVLTLALAPHFLRLPWWLSALFAIAVVWRWGATARTWKLLPRWFLPIPTLAVVATIIMQFSTPFGRGPGTALLASMAAMKLLEARAARDGVVLIMLSYLLLMANLLYIQTVTVALYMFAIVPLLLVAQMSIYNQHAALIGLPGLRLALRMLAQSIPMMFILFLLFPRIEGPLWHLPEDEIRAKTGLSDEMTPGSISELIQSDEVAFRVRFEGAAPPSNQLYWRGPVLSSFWDRTWRGREEIPSRTLPYKPLGEPIDYTVTLEPNGRHWLFALELPGRLPPEAGISDTYQLKHKKPVNDRLQYAMRSYLEHEDRPISQGERLAYQQLPTRGAVHARALSKSWRVEFGNDDAAIVNAALRYFREQEFYYTLKPPALGEDSVDEFLFETRRGFCEYYAGSFAFLMRAAKIPARVVLGYQGGERNGDSFIVRQSDAHAWTEVWLNGRGWARIDPTAAIAPERIEQGIYAAVANPSELPFFARRDVSWLRDLGLVWDRVNHAWIDWVLGYGPQRQQQFLSALGFDWDWPTMTIAMIVIASLIPLLGLAWLAHWRWRKTDPLTRSYKRFCRKLGRRGLPRAAYEGPISYTRRAAEHFPKAGTQIKTIGRLYAELRYGNQRDPSRRMHLHRLVRTLNP